MKFAVDIHLTPVTSAIQSASNYIWKFYLNNHPHFGRCMMHGCRYGGSIRSIIEWWRN
ncbi:hypothetical protein RP20_CCG016706 [Aedes albopictus]|nr:hypothetical protein RP20_CCG016706 [Aedes albopictus]